MGEDLPFVPAPSSSPPSQGAGILFAEGRLQGFVFSIFCQRSRGKGHRKRKESREVGWSVNPEAFCFVGFFFLAIQVLNSSAFRDAGL